MLGHASLVASSAGTTGLAVAGSLLLQQYAGLLAAPVVAGFYEEQRLLDCAMNSISVHCRDGQPIAVAFAVPGNPLPCGASAQQRTVARRLFDEHLAVCAELTRRRTRAGRRVLHGGIAAAIATAFLHLSWRRANRAHYVRTAQDFLAAIPELNGLVCVEAVEVDGEPWMYYDRRTCCLAFRTARNQARSNPYCAVCPVVTREATRGLFESATQAYKARQLNAE